MFLNRHVCYKSFLVGDDGVACEETNVAANVQEPMDAAADQCTPPSQEGSTVETEAGTAGENGKDVQMEASGEDKERSEEGMEEGSKVDGGGGDTQENDRPKQQKRKWGNREGRYCHSDFQ